MPFVDSRSTFSSFTGLDPKHPDDDALLYPWDRGAAPITPALVDKLIPRTNSSSSHSKRTPSPGV